MFEYIKRSSTALVEIESVINRKIIRKLKQLITIGKIKCSKTKCSYTLTVMHITILFMNNISIPLNTGFTKTYDITTQGGWEKEKCICECRAVNSGVQWHFSTESQYKCQKLRNREGLCEHVFLRSITGDLVKSFRLLSMRRKFKIYKYIFRICKNLTLMFKNKNFEM